MTKELLKRLPTGVRFHVLCLKNDYSRDADKTRGRAAGYCHGLMDAGLITDRERMLLFCYITL